MIHSWFGPSVAPPPYVNRIWVLKVATVGLFLVACSASERGDSSTGTSDIINGEQANDSSDDAIGSLMKEQADGSFVSFCTATLISADRILTAKHCAAQKVPAGGWDYTIGHQKLAFGIGADSRNPKQIVPIESVIISSIDEGGWAQLGSDVAVYRLSESITTIEPIAIATNELADSDEGKTFRAIGYGSQDQAETQFGTRHAGNVTLRAASGKMFHKMFGSLEAFESAIASHTSQGYVDGTKDALAQMFDRELLPRYEAWVGEAKGDAQTCHGDSGGPLLGTENGKTRIFGVVSGGYTPLFSTGCIVGTAYATFGPWTRQLITDELQGESSDAGISPPSSPDAGTAENNADQ